MPKLKKYEIDACVNQIKKKIVETYPKVEDAQIDKEYLDHWDEKVARILALEKNIEELEIEQRILRAELPQDINNYDYRKSDTQKRLEETIKRKIRSSYAPNIDKKEIEDFVIINADKELSEIIKTVCLQYGVN